MNYSLNAICILWASYRFQIYGVTVSGKSCHFNISAVVEYIIGHQSWMFPSFPQWVGISALFSDFPTICSAYQPNAGQQQQINSTNYNCFYKHHTAAISKSRYAFTLCNDLSWLNSMANFSQAFFFTMLIFYPGPTPMVHWLVSTGYLIERAFNRSFSCSVNFFSRVAFLKERITGILIYFALITCGLRYRVLT